MLLSRRLRATGVEAEGEGDAEGGKGERRRRKGEGGREGGGVVVGDEEEIEGVEPGDTRQSPPLDSTDSIYLVAYSGKGEGGTEGCRDEPQR